MVRAALGALVVTMGTLAGGCCCGPLITWREVTPGDAGIDGPYAAIDVGSDAPGRPDAPDANACPLVPSRTGAPCLGRTCETGAMCQAEVLEGSAPYSVRTGLGIQQGEPDPDHPGYYRAVATPEPSNDIPLHIATNDLCTAVCDARAFSSCTDCSSCSRDVGMVEVLETWQLYPEPEHGAYTGWCRANCVFDPDTNGGCPAGYTCSPSGNVCVEACTSDNECRLAFVPQRDGDVVSLIDPSRGTCNARTGRCDWTAPGTPHVGDPCASAADCAEDLGACLIGGTCAEYACEDAADTDPTTHGCERIGGVHRGVCLDMGGNDGSICVRGCVSSDDCLPGNGCVLFPYPTSFLGYCLGTCDDVPSDPDGPGPLGPADDVIATCRTDERCDMPPATAERPDPAGRCRPPCTTDDDCDLGRDERCEVIAPASEGFCRVPDQLCQIPPARDCLFGPDCPPPRGDPRCFFGQVCDLLAHEGEGGLCVDRCDEDLDCAAGDVCDATRGVCRTPCGAGCVSGEWCVGGYCEEAPR